MSTPYYAANSGSAPVVVQGHVVNPSTPAPTYNNSTSTTGYVNQGGETEEWTRGEKQPKRCQDAFFAILFYAHLAIMAWIAAAYAPSMAAGMYNEYAGGGGGRRLFGRFLADEGGDQQQDAQENNNEENVEIDMDSMLIVLAITGLIGFVLSTAALVFMATWAQGLIKCALFFNIITSLLIAIMSLLTGALPVAIMFFLMFAFTCYYTKLVWPRIPFAASNMKTSITAVRANMGLGFLAYWHLLLTFGYSIWWSLAAVSYNYVVNGCNSQGECETSPNGFVVFLFLVSYFWTAQVIKNTVHVTVAGTVGTWWFVPDEANSCCSTAVRESWFRAMTFSFGSICFGSLIVAIIQATKEILRQMREQDDGILMCIAECCLGLLESLVEYFNTWAFTYVGLYGYSFLEAGKNVMTLFRSRGWTTIITDMLIDSVLGMVSVGVGVITGLAGFLVAYGAGMDLGTAVGPFVIGFIFGFVLAATLFTVVSSAVNAVIVCYAEAPNEFQTNHPHLASEMRESWRQAWPNEFNY